MREQAGGGIRIRDLERAAMEYGEGAAPAAATRRQKPGRIAIVGAGLSGLTAAYELARKGYSVVVFEAQDGAGGRARELGEDVLSEADLEADFAPRRRGRRPARAVHSRGPGRGRGGQNALAALAPDIDAVYLAVGAAEADAGAALGYARRRPTAGSPSTRSRWRPASPGIYCGGEHPATHCAVVAHRLDRRRAPGGAVDREAASARVPWGVARRSRLLRDRAHRQAS